MTERNFPASFWDQNHNMAAAAASSSSMATAAAMGRSYADLYGAAADPLHAATGNKLLI